MGFLTWIIKKIGKTIGRNTSSLFYALLYREIFKEIYEITDNVEKSIEIMRYVGGEASLESLKRQTAILKFLPGEPDRVLKYFEVIWTIVFGMPLGDYEMEETKIEGAPYPEIRLKIKQCPVCGGYGSDKEDTVRFDKMKKDIDGMACGFIGMIEKVINYLLALKNNDFRMKIKEEKCFAKGDDILQFKCDIVSLEDLRLEIPSVEISEDTELQIAAYDLMLEEGPQKESILDKIRQKIDLDRIEEFIDGPLDSVKSRLSNLIRDKMHMEPEEFFDYFTNYERDLFKIAGYLGVHLLNEYGGLVEKFLSNNTFAKVAGYIFKQIQETYKIFIPLDVIDDYHQLFVEFLRNLAPEEMVEQFELLTAIEAADLIFEGAQGALEDLGINFEELKENIWEELKRQPPPEDEIGLAAEEIKGKGHTLIQIFQEVLMLINSILSLPVRMILAREHESIKTVIESTTSGGDVLESIKTHADKIFEYLEEMRA